MRLLLTVVDRPTGPTGTTPRTSEVEVEAPAGCTSLDLARALTQLLRAPDTLPDPVVRVGGVALADDALVGREPLVDGAVVALGSGADSGPTIRTSPRTPVALAVVHGPDAGRTVELAPGLHTVGRSAEATIRLDDQRASRLQAAVRVTPDGITVVDLSSTNGTYLDGSPVGTEPVSLVGGARIRVGDTVLAMQGTDTVPAALRPRSDGTFAVNRRPRLLSPAVATSIALPAPPDRPARTRVPWIAMLLPVPVAAVMALFLGPTMLAFALMSPLLMAGTALGDRVGNKRTYAAAHAAYQGHLADAQERVASACADEVRALRRALPDPCQTLAIATGPGARLWERRREDSDALTVSIGTCTAPARVRVIRPTGDDGSEHPALHQVPCVLPLATIGVIGVCGDRRAVVGVVRNVLGQLVVLHSPLDLDLTVVSGTPRTDPDWSWLGRLPHVRQPDGRPRDQWVTCLDADATARAAVSELAQLIRSRRAQGSPPAATWSGPRTVVVLDGAAALRGLPDLAEVLEHGLSVGVCVLALNADRAGLPSEAGAVLDLTTPAQASLHPDGAATDLVVDRVGAWWSDRLSRGLAPLRDATPGAQELALPTALGLAELLGRVAGPLEGAALARTWERTPHTTAVPVGLTTDGPFSMDLASDGPHILLAGTTGAGKSELLRSLVAALAVHNRPEHLSLVLVDYKGGAAFRECAGLPHVAGVVTDLDDHLADRALVSLMAELKRRERLLADAEVADFVAYQSSSTSTAAPLARLVIVVDEFRALAEELPRFVDGMVRVAALGRSLGVHVVLATQRPAGVVTADIKANVNLRIALRVRDRADSEDVIDAPDAAGLDRAVPGRGYARTGGGSLVAFQSAHAGGRSRPRAPRGIRVRAVEWDRTTAAWPVADDADTDPSDLAEVVKIVAQAAALVEARPAPSPWLPPLPTRLEEGSLAAGVGYRIPIGLADEPAAQRQRPLEIDLSAPGHWGFVGAAGSGRSSALLAASFAATGALDVAHLHLYAVSGGSLAAFEALPHCGAHVGWDDLPRLERLVARLSGDVADRRRRLAGSGHATMADWWEAADGSAPPALLVVVDDWDVLAQRTDELTHGTLVERLLGLLREGAGVGLTAVLAGDRALLVGRAAAALTHRVLLRLTDPADLLLAGLPARAVPTVQTPGRGVLLDGTEVQLVLPSGAMARDAAVDRPDWSDRSASSPGGERAARQPWRVDALPPRVDAASLSRPSGDDGWVPVGLGGDELATLGLSPGRDGRRWIVAGSNGTGVSTTLVTMAAALLRQGRRVAVVATRADPWVALRQDPRVLWCDDPTRPGELVTLRRTVPGLAVLVDDADELLDTAVEAALKQVAALVDRDDGLIVAGADASALSSQYRGLGVEVARHRTGVLLGPASAAEADLFGVRVPIDRTGQPGRGYLVRGGVATPLQVAMLDQGAEPASRVVTGSAPQRLRSAGDSHP